MCQNFIPFEGFNCSFEHILKAPQIFRIESGDQLDSVSEK